jgi:hypothetical protein
MEETTMRRILIACVLALGGCASEQTIENGVFEATCVSEGVRIDQDGEEPYDVTHSGTVEIRNGVLVREPCGMPIVGFDGYAFDLVSTSCEEPTRTSYFDGGMGTLEGDALRWEVDGVSEELATGVRYEYHSTCTATRIP